MVKNLPANTKDTIGSLNQGDLLEQEIISIPAWEILWTEEPGGLQSMASQRVR